MSINDIVNIPRGRTYYGPSQSVPTSYEGRTTMLEGIEATFKHTDPSDPSKAISNRRVRAILMRNVSGITCVAGLAVNPKAGYEGRRFDGYSCTTAEEIAGIIDDHLYSSGCRNHDMCWVIVEGPTYCRFAGGNAISAADFVHAQTAAASTACTSAGTTADDAGKFTSWEGLTSNATETTDGTNVKKTLNSWGRCLSAATTDNTASTKLVDLMVKK